MEADMNEHLYSMAAREHIQVMCEGGPFHGQCMEMHSPGPMFSAEGGDYGLSHRMPGDVLVYFFVSKADRC